MGKMSGQGSISSGNDWPGSKTEKALRGLFLEIGRVKSCMFWPEEVKKRPTAGRPGPDRRRHVPVPPRRALRTRSS